MLRLQKPSSQNQIRASNINRCRHLWEAGLLEDAALTSATLAAQEEAISSLAPRCAPAVLDLPVLLAILLTIANCEDAVVQHGTADTRHDAAAVQLEGWQICLHSNRDRLGIERRHHGRFGLCHISVAGDTALWDDSGARRLASSANCLVRVRSLGTDGLVLSPLESVVHETAIASLVTIVIAIHKLLLRHGGELARCQLPSTLKGTCGAKAPARTTLALVLDGGDSALGGPINTVCQRRSIPLMHTETHCISHLWLLETQHDSGELLDVHVGELIMTKLESALCIVLLDQCVVCLPISSGVVLLSAIVLFSKLLLP